uniref:Uncharacterized protein n=1 Tax=Avena sativa TaxID=4498 RepID=A0ACD5TCX6_AVESA
MAAAAALRYAAKRLGGGVLKRSKSAIVSDEGPRLATRLLHTPNGATTVDGRKAAVSHLIRIQEKKEELYNLVADFERTYKAPMSISWPNGALLHQLSTQIEPRPSDPYWRMLRRGQRKFSFFGAVGVLSVGISTGGSFGYGLLWLKKSYSKELEGWHSQKKKELEGWHCQKKKELDDWWNKNMRSTGAK